jgi:hypothetical protein
MHMVINVSKFKTTQNEKNTFNIINKFNAYWMRIN